MTAHELKPAQYGLLLGVTYAGPDGYNAAPRDPAMVALKDRGLIEWRGSKAKPRLERWHATWAGWQLVRDTGRERAIGVQRAIRAGRRRPAGTI